MPLSDEEVTTVLDLLQDSKEALERDPVAGRNFLLTAMNYISVRQHKSQEHTPQIGDTYYEVNSPYASDPGFEVVEIDDKGGARLKCMRYQSLRFVRMSQLKNQNLWTRGSRPSKPAQDAPMRPYPTLTHHIR